MQSLRKILLSSLLTVPTILLFSQEQLGLRLDNYSGIYGIISNPAAASTYQLGWDINLFGAGAFAINDIVYLKKTNLFRTYKNRENIGPDPALKFGFKGTPSVTFDFFDRPHKNKSAAFNIDIMGPSALVSWFNGHSYGFYTRFRALGSTHDMAEVTNHYELVRQSSQDKIRIDPFSFSFLSWSEFGLNYAYRLGDQDESSLALGATFKYLTPFQGGFARNFSGANIRTIGFDTIEVKNTSVLAGFTNNALRDPTQINGYGWGLDLGAVFTTISDRSKPYDWRFSVAMLDLGNVTMNRNTELHRFDINETTRLSPADFKDIDWNDPLNDGLRILNQKIYGKDNGSFQKSKYFIMLPATLQLQADWAITPNVFLNGLIQQRLPSFQIMLERENILAITPRYESRWFGASMPIVVNNFRQTRVGLAGRIGFLTIGTDYLGGFAGKGNLTGMDFYMALRVNPFEVGKFSGIQKRKRNPRARCFKF